MSSQVNELQIWPLFFFAFFLSLFRTKRYFVSRTFSGERAPERSDCCILRCYKHDELVVREKKRERVKKKGCLVGKFSTRPIFHTQFEIRDQSRYADPSRSISRASTEFGCFSRVEKWFVWKFTNRLTPSRCVREYAWQNKTKLHDEKKNTNNWHL